MDRELIKKLMRWFVILLVAHIAARFIFVFFVGNIGGMQIDNPSAANQTMFLYSTVFQIILVIFLAKGEASYSSYSKSLREALREPGFSLLGYYKRKFLIEHLLKIAIFAVFQLPFTVFFAIWGFSLEAPTFVDKFYILDAGSYALTGSALLGFLLNVSIFAAVLIGAGLVLLFISKRDSEYVM